MNIVVPPEASIRMNFGVQQLQETLEKEGYRALSVVGGIRAYRGKYLEGNKS